MTKLPIEPICTCGHSRIAHYRSWADGKWHACCAVECTCKKFEERK